MGINDVCALDEDLIGTASSDGRILTHKLDLSAGSITQQAEFTLAEAEIATHKEKQDKQQLAVTTHNNSVLACSLTSDINVWPLDKAGEPSETLRGHNNTIEAMCVHEGFLITGDNDGRVLVWDLATGQAQKPKGFF